MSQRRTVLAVRLWSDSLGALAGRSGGPVHVASFGDSNEAREWLGAHPDERVVVVARLDESDLWALNALLAVVRRRDDRAPVLVLTPHPRAALPVLLTDLGGLTVVDPADRQELAAALDVAVDQDVVLARR